MTLAQISIILEKIKKEDIDKQMLRTGILAELDAINLYEQMANITDNKNLKTVLMAVAKEEKEHVGEFQYLLLKYDTQQDKEFILYLKFFFLKLTLFKKDFNIS